MRVLGVWLYIYIRRKNMCQIGCADHSAVATPDKGSKPKKDIYIHIYIYIYMCVYICIFNVYMKSSNAKASKC